MFEIRQVKDRYIFELDKMPVLCAYKADGFNDTFNEISEGIFEWVREGKTTDHMEMKLETAFDADFWMVPGVNYNGNGFGMFCEYLGDRYQGIPWTYGWERCSVPSMTMSQGKVSFRDRERRVSVCLFSEPNDNNCCSIYREDLHIVQRIKWPEEESPRSLNIYRYDDAYYGDPVERSNFKAYLVIEADPVYMQGYRRALNFAFAKGAAGSWVKCDEKNVWERSISFANTLYTEEPEGFCGFYIGLYSDGNTWKKNSNIKYEIGWGGQNALLANSMIRQSLLYPKDRESMKRGFAVLDSWIHFAHLPIGITHTSYDTCHTRTLESCDLGAAGMEFFEASHLADVCGEAERALKYFTAAMDICNFAIDRQEADGSLAKSWNEDGTTAVSEGTTGAFMAMPLLRAYEETGAPKWLDSARRIVLRYCRELHEKGFTTAGAQDIFSIDKESAIPLLKSSLMLYKITHEKLWLEEAEYAAWYLATWQYCSSEKFSDNTIMGRTHYDTFGGTLVSTVHQGMDSFALSYVPELYELYRATGNKIWYYRARAIWRNGCQHISDGTFQPDGAAPRPVGSQDEFYETSRQSLSGKKNSLPGTPSGWLVAWPCAFRLEVLWKLKDIPEYEDFFQN